MLFESTTTLLRTIVFSIEDHGESKLDDHLEFGHQCLYELHQLARPSARTPKSDSKGKFQVASMPPFERAIRAIPHVKSMMRAIRSKDQVAAVASGRAAISAMEGIAVGVPRVLLAEPQADTTAKSDRPRSPAKTTHAGRRSTKPKRVGVAKRQSAVVGASITR